MARKQQHVGEKRVVTISAVARLSDDEIEEIVEEWKRVQIINPETGEELHDSI